MITLNGFILSYLKYGDNDAIIHSFTREKGFQNFFIRGIYSTKNKKKAYLFPFNKLCFILNSPRQRGDMATISKLELNKNFDFSNDIKASSIIFFAADFLNQILRHEEASDKIYHEIEKFLSELESKNYQCHFVLLFKILKIQGFSPLVSEGGFLNPEDGKFSNESVHHLFNREVSSLWKQLILAENPYSIKINSILRKDFLDSLLVYYHEHISNFRTPSSLEIVQQLFD